MNSNLAIILRALTILLVISFSGWAQEPVRAADDTLTRDLAALRELLIKHYQPMVPVANYRPLVKATFESEPFTDCNLKWRLKTELGKGSFYFLDIAMNLGDIDPASVRISKDLKRKSRWFVELQVMNAIPKINVTRGTINGGKVDRIGSFLSPQVGFDSDEETIHQLADAFSSIIKQCRKA